MPFTVLITVVTLKMRYGALHIRNEKRAIQDLN